MQNGKLQHIGLAAATALLLAACSKHDNGTKPPPPPPVVINQISLSDLKKLSSSASVTVPDNTKIRGTVISDAGKKNIAATTVVLQDAAGGTGLVVNFGSAPTAALGDLVEINISKQTLAQVNGEVVLQGIVADSLKKVGSGTITPKQTNAKELAQNATAWDGTLVNLPAGSFSGGSGKYSGTLQYTDSTGAVASVVATGAVFENTSYPVAVNNLIGIVRVNGTAVQVNLRDSSDAPAKQGYFLVDDFSGADLGYYSAGTFVFNILKGSANYPHTLSTDAVTAHAGSYINSQGKSSIFATALWGFNLSYGIPFYGAAGAADGDFTSPGRNYLTLMPVYNSPGRDGPSFIFQYRYYGKNLKSMTIVFAGSKQQSTYQDLIATGDVSSITWDNSNTGSFRVKLYGDLGTTGVDSSAVFQDKGVWHTVKFDNVSDKYNALNIPATSTTGIINFGAPVEGYNQGTLVTSKGTYNVGAPIIIDKIILEFSQKPEWW